MARGRATPEGKTPSVIVKEAGADLGCCDSRPRRRAPNRLVANLFVFEICGCCGFLYLAVVRGDFIRRNRRPKCSRICATSCRPPPPHARPAPPFHPPPIFD
ncbi:MAG: hypothetical protein IPM55_20915 [Acidobacteria bacterium]|nr:hypothetical protein [Acidobacteriota bacterium]